MAASADAAYCSSLDGARSAFCQSDLPAHHRIAVANLDAAIARCSWQSLGRTAPLIETAPPPLYNWNLGTPPWYFTSEAQMTWPDGAPVSITLFGASAPIYRAVSANTPRTS
jgi:hypothetical protein